MQLQFENHSPLHLFLLLVLNSCCPQHPYLLLSRLHCAILRWGGHWVSELWCTWIMCPLKIYYPRFFACCVTEWTKSFRLWIHCKALMGLTWFSARLRVGNWRMILRLISLQIQCITCCLDVYPLFPWYLDTFIGVKSLGLSHAWFLEYRFVCM